MKFQDLQDMPNTLIETSTNKRFATKFTVLENFRPVEEFVLVFKDVETSPNFLVVKYGRDEGGNLVQRGTLEEVNEEEFKRQNKPHSDWDRTTLNEYDKKFESWRSLTVTQKLEQVEKRKL